MEMKSGEKKNETFLFQKGKCSYHIVTKEYRDQVLVVLARAFCSSPVGEMKVTFLDWFEYLNYFMDHDSTNGMSVMALDIDTKRVVGAFTARGCHVSDEAREVYSSNDKDMSPIHQLYLAVEEKGLKTKPQLQRKPDVVDLSVLGVLPEFRGNKITNYLIKAVLPLAKKAGYKYAVCMASSILTEKACASNHFEKVCEIDPKTYKLEGKQVLCFKESPWSFWMKDLGTL